VERFRKILLIAFALPVVHAAANYPLPKEADWVIRDFHFSTGEILPEVRIHYTTVGKPTGDPVLILHGTTRSGSMFLVPSFADEMFGAGQPLDASKYFVIMPDAIGSGKSSKPSDGLKGRFPRYTYEDMVRAQYRLVSEHLGIGHLRLIIGGSMGGMHVWMWGEMYPDFMDGLMPLQCLPVEVAGMNRMLRRVVIDSIRTDPEWRNGDYDEQPTKGLIAAQYGILALFADPVLIYKAAPTGAQADASFDQRIAQGAAATDANDLLYQYEASRDYNPSPTIEKIRASLIAINTADDSANPPELGIMEREIARLPHGRYVLVPRSVDTIGHLSYPVAKLYKRYVIELLSFR